MGVDKHSKLYDHLYNWQRVKKNVIAYSEMITRAATDRLVETKEISGQDFMPKICINTNALTYSCEPMREDPIVFSKMGYTYRISRDFGRVHVHEPLSEWQELAELMMDFSHRSNAINVILYDYLKLGDINADDA